MEELFNKAKQSLSIISISTLKDEEIRMWINAGISDMTRQGILVDIADELVVATIIMFVKANFGMTDIKEKELANKTYSLLCTNLSLSSKYKAVGE